MDIDKMLNALLEKYDVPMSKSRILRKKEYNYIRDYLKQVCTKYNHVAIRCGGMHTWMLQEEFGEVLKIEFIIDKDINSIRPHEKFKDIKKLPSYEKNIDAVIVSTSDYNDEVKAELLQQGCREEQIFDIYQMLKEKGMVVEDDYWKYEHEPYKEILQIKQELKNESNERKKEELNYRLICSYFDICDLFSAFKLIDEYVEQYESHLELIELKKELEQLLSAIKEKIAARQVRDIVWLWQDGMPAYMLDKATFLCEEAQKGLYFAQSYTPSPVTRSIYGRTLDAMEEYDVYKHPEQWPEKHKTIERLKSEGYKSELVTTFDKENINLETIDYHLYPIDMKWHTLTELYWNMLKTLVSNEKPCFLLVHTGVETHEPALSPFLDEYEPDVAPQSIKNRFSDEGRNAFLTRLEKNVEYVDCQLRFLADILSDNVTKIYMSDHGRMLCKNTYPFTKDKAQEILIVSDNRFEHKQYDELFCITSFYNLIEYILNPSSEHEKNMFSKYIWLNGVDTYNKRLINEYIDLDFMLFGVGYDGIMTYEDRYVVLGNGMEIYNKFPDDYTNQIHNPKFVTRISELKKIYEKNGKRLIDYRDNPKFSNTHILYEAIEEKINNKER